VNWFRIRDPRSFTDVIVVVFASVALVALVVTLTDSPLIRLELLLFFAVTIVWVIWAVNNILERTR
jgi:hypothetical protein